MNEKVTFKNVNSASVVMDNSVDTARVYDIQASVNVSGNKSVNGIDNGTVVAKDGVTKANFNRYGENNMNIQFYTSGVSEMCSVATAIDTFVNDVIAKVGEGEVLSTIL